MAKKREREADGTHAPEKADKNGHDDQSSEDEDFDMVDVEFEWFNFDPEIDFHGTKSLLRQLLDVDSALFDISGLADLILSQPTIGSTVKVNGKEADPYALVTALNIAEHQSKDPFATLTRYLRDKAKATEGLEPVTKLLSNSEETKKVGLVLAERLINMPSEISPPMYSMLVDELEAAVEDGEPYTFDYYLVVSKTYQEVESALDVEERKKKKGRKDPATFYFHPEDEVLARHASAVGSYAFTKHDESVADSKRAFQEMGVVPMGHMILIEADKWDGAVKAIGEYLKPPS